MESTNHKNLIIKIKSAYYEVIKSKKNIEKRLILVE